MNPNQQKGGYIQPASFSSHGSGEWSRGGDGDANWGRGGGGRRENARSSEFSFAAQNRFSALDAPGSFDRDGRRGDAAAAGEEDDDKKL